jgi:hypothetical protein
MSAVCANLDAQQHIARRESYSDRMDASEIARADDARRAFAKCNPASTVLDKSRTVGYTGGEFSYRRRDEFLHETMTDLLADPKLSHMVMRALMLCGKRGVIEAQEALEALAMQFGIENAEASE